MEEGGGGSWRSKSKCGSFLMRRQIALAFNINEQKQPQPLEANRPRGAGQGERVSGL